jgi:hypothetical protein
MDIADAYEPDLRRLLRSAERFSERAMLRGSSRANTPLSSVSASLVCVTRCDQRLRVRAAISVATARRHRSFRCVRKR